VGVHRATFTVCLLHYVAWEKAYLACLLQDGGLRVGVHCALCNIYVDCTR